MGIYDRDYYRDEPRRSLMGNWSAVNFLIVVNVAIFVLDLFTDPVGRGERWLDAHMALRPDLITHPWNFWTLLSYGFAHDPTNILHVGGNMFVLWIFGVDVERLYGRERFMRVYLSLVVSSGLAWLIIQAFSKTPAPVIGASGAIMGIMVMYVLNFPNRVFLLYFVVPVPAWALGIVYIGMDIFGVLSPSDNTAHAAHIAGALFGLLYVRTGWYLGALLPTRMPKWAKLGGPKLRVRSEDDEPRTQREVQMRVDEILEKISREGESSLTPAERSELEELSRRFRNRR
jgi:membrane associated rhomboid family serine protease